MEVRKTLAILFTSFLTLGSLSYAKDASNFKPVVLRFANQHPSDSTASQSDREICEEVKKPQMEE